MNLIQAAISRPVTVLVGVILLTLFGVLAAVSLPIQLTPDVDKPLVTVTTRWEGAAPMEVEREIIDEQEEQLKSVQGVVKMNSTAVEGSGSVELEFSVGTDVNRALLDVNDRLRQVRDYPETVEQPVISAGETQGSGAIAWFILKRLPGAQVDLEGIPRLRTLMEEVVKPLMERAKGVATVGVVGGVEKEVHVQIDPRRLAARDLTLLNVRDALRGQNIDTSAGTIDQGKRAYTVRTVGKFERLDELESLVLARRNGSPVYLRDVGSAAFGYKKPEAVVRSLGEPAIAINATRQSGTNVIAVMEELQKAVEGVNERVLQPLGLRLIQAYDQTTYIDSAISLVFQNLWVGGAITVMVLLLFLGSLRSTLIVAVAIPISVIGSFLALTALGRNLNVVSLAGLAFAVGMVVDNSIVVLENIHRHRQLGESAAVAALKGAQEVWGAVLASTLTTLAVF
ncbi:MAG: efflux RND transporter permease subunit, partial [Planctomycetota bacterium]